MPRASASAAAAKPRRKRSTPRVPQEEIRLTGDRIVVRNPDDGERVSRAGLLIPATTVSAPRRCQWSAAVLVGPDVRGVKEGDRVLFLPQAGLEIELNGEEYLLLRERDVQAVASPTEGEARTPGQYL